MSQVTVFENSSARLSFHPDTKIVHHEFRTFMHGPAFRDILTQGVATMQKNGAHKWLSDDRLNSALPKEDGDWAMTTWFPSAVRSGWKFWAVVMPEKVIGQMNMQQFVKNAATSGVTTKVFSNPDEAYRWLAAAA